MIWFRCRKRDRNCIPADLAQAQAESVAALRDAQRINAEAAEVSSNLRDRRVHNHFAESFRAAMGGGVA